MKMCCEYYSQLVEYLQIASDAVSDSAVSIATMLLVTDVTMLFVDRNCQYTNMVSDVALLFIMSFCSLYSELEI